MIEFFQLQHHQQTKVMKLRDILSERSKFDINQLYNDYFSQFSRKYSVEKETDIIVIKGGERFIKSDKALINTLKDLEQKGVETVKYTHHGLMTIAVGDFIGQSKIGIKKIQAEIEREKKKKG